MSLQKRIEAAERAVETRRTRQSLAMQEASALVRRLFPSYVRAEFAPHHLELLEWAQSVQEDEAPRPFIGIWPRGGGKSTLVELIVALLGILSKRKYCLYVSETQAQADQHVQNVASLLESKAVEESFPEHSERQIGKYGTSKGWRRDRIRTSGGFTVDAYGLDTAARGVKVDEDRPDIIVLDDIDSETDTARTTQRKIDLITRAVLPTGTATCAVVAIQNLVIPHGVFSKLSDGRADFLSVRVLSGPIPAIYDLRTERRKDEETGRFRDVIVSGEPSWPAGQSLEDCQRTIERVGLTAFLAECQHDVHERQGALWNRAMLARCRIESPPMNDDGTLHLRRIVLGIDPSGGRAEWGITAVGIGYDGKAYVLRDATLPGEIGPGMIAGKIYALYLELRADCVVVERNYGGDMVKALLKTVTTYGMKIREVTASRGKQLRAEPVAALYGTPEVGYEDGVVFHCGAFPELEREMTGWQPGDASPNRLDALVWALTDLMIDKRIPAFDPFLG